MLLPEPPILPLPGSSEEPHASSGSFVEPEPPVLEPEPPVLEPLPPAPLSVALPPPVLLSEPLPPPVPLSVAMSVPSLSEPLSIGLLPQARLTEQATAPIQKAAKTGRLRVGWSELWSCKFFMRSPRKRLKKNGKKRRGWNVESCAGMVVVRQAQQAGELRV